MTVPFIHARYTLPITVDYRASARMNDNQFFTNACTAFATLSTAECFLMHHAGVEMQFSQRHNYYHSRILNGNFPNDTGSKGALAVQVAEDIGMAFESDWPFLEGRDLNAEPPATLPTVKAGFVSLKYDWQLGEDAKIREMKYMLAEGMMITASAKLMWDWAEYGMSLGYKGTQGNAPDFVHQIAIVGYNTQGFIIENSYGGDHFTLFPYSCSSDLYSVFAVTRVGDVNVTMSDPDLLENALRPYVGHPAEFRAFMQGLAATSPNWATFDRYMKRHGDTAEAALEFCRVLNFERVSALATWVDSAS